MSWTLAADRRAQNVAQSRRTKGEMPSLAICPECKAVRFQGHPCSSCGWRPTPKAKPVEVAEGDLGHVGRDGSVRKQDYDQQVFFAQLLWIAQERRYKSGWAAHKFKEKFGTWPKRRWVPPQPPDDAVRAWVRSRQIAYARALTKAGAA